MTMCGAGASGPGVRDTSSGCSRQHNLDLAPSPWWMSWGTTRDDGRQRGTKRHDRGRRGARKWKLKKTIEKSARWKSGGDIPSNTCRKLPSGSQCSSNTMIMKIPNQTVARRSRGRGRRSPPVLLNDGATYLCGSRAASGGSSKLYSGHRAFCRLCRSGIMSFPALMEVVEDPPIGPQNSTGLSSDDGRGRESDMEFTSASHKDDSVVRECSRAMVTQQLYGGGASRAESNTRRRQKRHGETPTLVDVAPGTRAPAAPAPLSDTIAIVPYEALMIISCPSLDP
ncbi:hypothetical protein BGW80DRAFT_296416 [Lactifluus volemus]|nr:hypothetical protein BGW80DRAFT_296416 [Lactifluus volemus]